MRIALQVLIFIIALLLHGVRDVFAQSGVEPPAVGQPPDFSQVVGSFQIQAEATPVRVDLEDPIVVTATITGQAVEPYTPQQERLRLFPETTVHDFFIEPLGVGGTSGRWVFSYQLRPKRKDVTLIPGLKLVYYAPRQGRYQTAYADAIAITVTPRAEPTITVPGLSVVQAPPEFFELAEETPLRAWGLAPAMLVIFLLAPPLLCLTILRVVKRRTRTTNRRQRVVDDILRSLQASDFGKISDSVVAYLRDVLGFPASEPTGAEVDRWLKRLGTSATVRLRWKETLAILATGRFAPDRSVAEMLQSDELCALITDTEEEPCLAVR